MIGQTGTVTGTLNPRGVVQVANEAWTAVSEDGTVVQIGEPVQVASVDGLVLTVSRRKQPDS